ncbi:MAG: ferrous iron transport protein A [Deltaproteobacteria bacterium]|nr:ferrous iron transport protein A [Deltaproteobacteria bacterium]
MEKALTELKNNECGIIATIQGGRGVTDRLNALGIIPGKKVTNISSSPFHGPVTIQVDRTKIAIGYGMAEKIIVLAE